MRTKLLIYAMLTLLALPGAMAQTGKKNTPKGKKGTSMFVEGRQKIREKDVFDNGDSAFYTVDKFTTFSTKLVRFYYVPYDYRAFLNLEPKKSPDWGALKPAMNFIEKVSRAQIQMCLVYAINPDILDAGEREKLSSEARTEGRKCIEKFQEWLKSKEFRNKTNMQVAEIDYRYFKGADYYNSLSTDDVIHVGVLLYFGTKKKSFFPDPNESTRSFKDIKFFPNDATIVDSWYQQIDDLADYLKENDRKGVLLVGYSDNQGTEAYCMGLSRQRATEVKKALLMRGISASRIEVDAKGDADPIGDNNTYEGRVANNRVSITIQ